MSCLKILLHSLLICGLVPLLDAFLPNQVRNADTSDSLSHKEITRAAVHRMAVLYMNDYPDMYPDHEQAMSKADFKNALSTFQDSAAAPDVTLPYSEDPIVHFNSELIIEGNQRVLTERSKVVNSIIDEDWTGAREFTGGILHSIQDFYSHTNWVEMGNEDLNYALGQPGGAYDIGRIATLEEPTCSDCESSDYQTCTNNILSSINEARILTSGYIKNEGPEYADPSDYKPFGKGKCSHGGHFDITVDISGTGGINKDANIGSVSPHHYLHSEAAQLAEEASVEFLKSIREIRTDKEFSQYIGLTAGTSLCFFVDTTGSMSDEIAAVREATINITRERAGSEDAPSEYVLAPFNDPHYGPLHKTSDPEEMIEILSNLTANGGGDGPELAFSGMILALNNVRSGSTCYGFTDAEAKDSHLESTAISLALANNVKVVMLLTASSRRESSINSRHQQYKKTGHHQRSVSSIMDYDRITRESGGQLIVTPKSQIGEVVKLVDLSLTATQVTVFQTDNLVGTDETVIALDDTLDNIILSITTTGTITSVDVKDPTGTSQVPGLPGSNADVILVTDTTTVKMYSVTSSKSGLWSVDTVATGTFSVKVTADSVVDFRYNFMEEVKFGIGGYRMLGGRPIKGAENIIVVQTFGASVNSGLTEITDLVLVSETGAELTRLPLYELVPFAEYEVSTMLPDQGFRVILEGKDMNGNRVQRWDPVVVRTSESYITVTDNHVLTAGEVTDVNITVTNEGPADTYTLTVQDDKNFFVDLTQTTFSLTTGESRMAIAKFSAPLDVSVGVVSTVSVNMVNVAGDDTNFAVFRLSSATAVIDTTAPVCLITMTVGDCASSLNHGIPCQDEQWSLAFISSDDIGLFNIKPSENHPSANFTLDWFVPGNMSTTGSYISDCCVPRVTITASDALGNAGRCSVEYQPMDNKAAGETPGIGVLFIMLALGILAYIIV